MDGFGGWMTAGLVGLVAAGATPAHAQGRAAPAAEIDAAVAREFAERPTFETFANHAFELEIRFRAIDATSRPHGDPTLDWMAAELAKGEFGPVPSPRADVATLQRRVAATARDDADADARAALADTVRDALQLWAEPYWQDAERALAVAASIPLPPVRASYFADDGAIAAGSDTPDLLGGRFGIVHRWVMAPARRATDIDDYVASTYGWARGTHLLVRPLQRVRLSADGTLAAAPSHARVSRSVNLDVMCEGWTPGFALGGLDADDSAWRAFDEHWPDARTEAAQPAGVLYSFYVATPLPAATAAVGVRSHDLDRVATGFARATSYVFDVDHDAVPDLLVWEAAGPGPGHLDGPTATDDTWYRLVLVNTGGAWKVLGTDQFSYGCGC